MTQGTRSAGWLGRRIVPAVVGLALASPAAAAAAEPPRPAEAQDVSTTVRKHFDAAQAAYKRQDYAAAYESYRAAWKLQKSYDIAANLGGVELKLEKTRDAADHLAYALRNFPPTASLKAREALQGRLDRVAAKLGRVRVRVSVPGAVVKLNGEEVGASPIDHEVFVEPGKKSTLTAEKEGYRAATAEVSVAAGASAEAALALEAEKAAAPVGGAAGAAVERADAGGVPGQDPTLTNAMAGPQASRDAAAIPSGTRKSVPLIAAGIGLSVVGVGVGVTGLALSGGQRGTADEIHAELSGRGGNSACNDAANATRCEELRDAYRGTGTFRNMGIVGFVVGGAAAIGTVVYVLLPSSGDDGGGLRVGASVVPGAGRVVLGGTF